MSENMYTAASQKGSGKPSDPKPSRTWPAMMLVMMAAMLMMVMITVVKLQTNKEWESRLPEKPELSLADRYEKR